MKNTFDGLESAIGNTPLVRLKRIEEAFSLQAKLYAKVESANPAGSIKDRVALSMIDAAEKDGRLKKGGVVMEPTSGNTGIGIAAVAAARGYKAVIVMPDTMSVERRQAIAAYGAELVLTPGAEGMKGAIRRADELAAETPGAVILGQFTNPANPAAHYKTTGPEIFSQTEGEVAALVAGVGTGGTITGAGKFLKEKNPAVYAVAVEPASSPVLSGGKAGAHKLQGIGAGFMPEVLDAAVIDEVIAVTDEDAYAAGRTVAKTEGFTVGISSGAALYAAIKVAGRKEFAGKTVVVIFPDGGSKYLSVPGYLSK